MMVIGLRLHWVAPTGRWTITEDVADANGCESHVIAEYSEMTLTQPWKAPKMWAAEVIGCDASDFVGVVDEFYGRPLVWHVTGVLQSV